MPRSVVLACVLFAFAGSSNSQVFGLLLVSLAERLGSSVAALGGLRSVESGASILVGLLAAPILDRYSRRSVLVVGFGLTLASVACLLVSGRVWALPIFFALNGAGVILIISTALTLPSDYLEGAALSRMMGLIVGSFALKSILLLPLVGWVAERFGWRAGFLISGGLAALGLLAALTTLGGERHHRPASTRERYRDRFRQLLGQRRALVLLASASLRFGQYVALLTFLSAVVIERFGLSLPRVGLVFSLLGIAFFLGSLASGLVVGRLGPGQVLISGGGLVALGFVLGFGLDVGLAGTLLAVLALSATLAAQESVTTVQLLRLAPSARGAVMSWSELSASTGGLLGVALGAGALRLDGVRGLGLLLAVLAVLGAVVSALALAGAESLDGASERSPAGDRR